jgi:hypothetical protein
MTHIEKLHLDSLKEAAREKEADTERAFLRGGFHQWLYKKSAEVTENIACEFAIFFNGKMPMNCKEIMRRQDLPNEEKVKLVFKEYLKTKENEKIVQ